MKKLQEAYIEGSIKSRLLEQQANQINREIDSYTADMHQHTNNEKENLIKVFHMDEAVSCPFLLFLLISTCIFMDDCYFSKYVEYA